jgi:Protein of unknown function (DUF2997)
MKKTIEIIITPTGQTTVQTTGFTGPSCRDASKFIQEALGQQTNERLTSEFYQTAQARAQNRQQT